MEPTYENITPILQSHELEGNMLKCKFKAANQENEIEAFHVFEPNTKEVVKDAGKKAVKQSLFSSVVSIFSRGVSSAAGGGVAGYAAGSATRASANAAIRSKQKNDTGFKVNVTDEMKKQGAVKAFESVKSFYEAEGSSWKFKI